MRRVIHILIALCIASISQLYAVSPNSQHTLEVITNHGTRYYQLDNSGDVDVATPMQKILDEIASLEDVSATMIFSPGIYYINAPLTVKLASVKMVGHGHSGIDIHGANLATGTIFRFGKECGPYCITFNYVGRSKSFPAGETPWLNKNLKVELENIAFVGYNNTGVDTAGGYSRWRKDKPLFAGLNWYPADGRYEDVERDGQRAIYLPAGKTGGAWWHKCELLRVTGCYFTELYAGIDASWTDVSYIDRNWFGQLTYAIRLSGPGMMVSNNLFADMECAVKVKNTNFSAYSNNTFAYVGKCFEFEKIENSTVSGNSLFNKKGNTGAARAGGFIYVAKSAGLNVVGNSVSHNQDSRKRNIAIDEQTNGESYLQFDNSTRLNFSQNIIHTTITQTVVRLHNCTNSVVADNIIVYGEGGNAVAQTGECSGNYYRKVKVEDSDPFDEYKY